MAYERLRESLTRGNLWLYILTTLEGSDASPGEVRERVRERFGFSAAGITFYSVLYRLRREGLVRKASGEFRSTYEITGKGREELERARRLIKEVGGWMERPARGT
ncbi:MAG: PadR family transcriptional regulator [Nitrososphaerales archaeon]|nr:PadR family transcriptional regulator [Nitrososphaerales archaeon]